jgi:hypothetical protein
MLSMKAYVAAPVYAVADSLAVSAAVTLSSHAPNWMTVPPGGEGCRGCQGGGRGGGSVSYMTKEPWQYMCGSSNRSSNCRSQRKGVGSFATTLRYALSTVCTAPSGFADTHTAGTASVQSSPAVPRMFERLLCVMPPVFSTCVSYGRSSMVPAAATTSHTADTQQL